MTKTNTILTQLLEILPRKEFASFVIQNKGDKYVKHFSCWQQLITLLYAQTTGKDSLREIETGLKCQKKSWFHLGIEGVSKSNLARANRDRNYHIYESLFYALLNRCHELIPNHEKVFNFQNDLYSLDSTTINVCLNLFPWAEFRKQKGAFKLHTLFNNRSQIPEMIVYSDAKTNDMKAAETMSIELKRDSILVADRAYIKYEWLYQWHKQGVFFVLRTKKNMNYVVTGQHKEATESGVLKDEIIELILEKAGNAYPEKLCKITYYCEIQKKTYTFFTNNFEFSAKTIADIYKSRWQIELFFKWIKQHLKIKTFLGTSKNAVMTQIWIAMIYYLLLSYIKFQTKFKKSILELARMINETLLQKISLIHLLSLTDKTIHKTKLIQTPQLAFF